MTCGVGKEVGKSEGVGGSAGSGVVVGNRVGDTVGSVVGETEGDVVGVSVTDGVGTPTEQGLRQKYGLGSRSQLTSFHSPLPRLAKNLAPKD